MMEAKDVLSKPVISVESGQEIGKVRELLFQPGKHQLAGLVIDAKEKGPKLFLQRGRIRAMGEDAVTVSRNDDVEVFDANTDARELVDSGGHLRGMSVLTEDGNMVGKIDKVLLNDDGTISCYRASSGLMGLGGKQDISPDEIVSAGEDAIIVPGGSGGQEPDIEPRDSIRDESNPLNERGRNLRPPPEQD